MCQSTPVRSHQVQAYSRCLLDEFAHTPIATANVNAIVTNRSRRLAAGHVAKLGHKCTRGQIDDVQHAIVRRHDSSVLVADGGRGVNVAAGLDFPRQLTGLSFYTINVRVRASHDHQLRAVGRESYGRAREDKILRGKAPTFLPCFGIQCTQALVFEVAD